MDDKLSIKLNIDGHTYPMKVARDDEERFRKAATLINERIKIYKQRFQDKKDYDFLAMVAIELVVKYIGKEAQSDDTELLSELRIMSSEIQNYIQNINAL